MLTTGYGLYHKSSNISICVWQPIFPQLLEVQ